MELETAGSESVVSYETAEQSLMSQVSQSEVAQPHNSLSVSGDNPECLALDVNNTNPPPARLRLTTNSHNLA